MPATWRVNDLMDLEYFLAPRGGDPPEKTPTEGLSSDRRLYLDYGKSHTPPFARRDLIKFWLEEKQKNYRQRPPGDAPLPGDAFREAMGLTRALAMIAAVFSGAGLAWSVLSYSGAAPINIFTCLWVLLVPQLALLAALVVSLLFSRTGAAPFKGLYPLLAALFRRLFERMKKTGGVSLTGGQRLGLSAMAGLIGHQKSLYGPVFFWPIFILAQVFAVFFNIGILGAGFLKLTLTDLAFGWQSTLHPAPDTVYRLVKGFSLPWSAMPAAHPTMAEIQGSQMILKDGMVHLSTPDLVSWWPFLCYAVLFYGLLPRLILLLFGIYRQHLSLSRVSFSTSACDRLIHRMQTPGVQSVGRAYRPSRDIAPSHDGQAPSDIPPEIRSGVAALPALVLIPEDIRENFDNSALTERLAEVLGLTMTRPISIGMDPATDMENLAAALFQDNSDLSAIRIVVLLEAWQPPIRETLTWIAGLRKTAGPETGIVLALIGKPGNQSFLAPAKDTDRLIWDQAVKAMGDPFIRVENLGGG